ncbi:MAG: glycosyltransferase family 2 protein [Paludibacteraceae bacterium]|nr:glycosyltransferase family 2 protein [Paludibacteraceae bacterium]
MATYNGAAFVEEQLRSILAQLGENDEIIVSDDGSTDATLAVIRAVNDPRIRLLPPHEPLGSTRNFYRALDAAQGNIIFLSDQDDVWLPGRVEHCLKELEKAYLVVTDCQVVDESLQVLYPSLFRLYGLREGLWHNLLRCGFYGSLMAMRRSVVERAKPWPKNDELIKHDWWLGMVAEKTGTVRFVDDRQYVLYRRHQGTETSVDARLMHRSKRSLKTKIVARLCMAKEILLK